MIKVGDIVKTKEKKGSRTVSAVVTKVYIWGSKEEIAGVDVLFADGTNGGRIIEKIKETGRHIDMQSVLDSINNKF